MLKTLARQRASSSRRRRFLFPSLPPLVEVSANFPGVFCSFHGGDASASAVVNVFFHVFHDVCGAVLRMTRLCLLQSHDVHGPQKLT